MNGISCFANFKENLSKNAPYYKLLMNQICDDYEDFWIGENAALTAGLHGSIVTKICEGYQFTIAFFGKLLKADQLKEELAGFGYHFLSEKDAELALLCYIHFGEKCILNLSGRFSFIIYDAMRRQIFAFSSENAPTPLFYGKTSGGYAICSYVNGIISCPDAKKCLTGENILEFISVQNRIPDSIFNNVHFLPPSHQLKISTNSINIKACTPSDTDAKNNTNPNPQSTGVILSGTYFDLPLIKNMGSANIYAERLPDGAKLSGNKFYPTSIDKGTLLYGLELSVTACGFPVLSEFDYLLPITIRCAKGTDEALSFIMPDKFSPYKTYLPILMENDVFHPAIKENLLCHTPVSRNFPDYSTIIGSFFNVEISSLSHQMPDKSEKMCAFSASLRIKSELRHILLNIISKDHAPILAFFKRSALLKLCEGKFTFPQGFTESELTAYLIKLNIWLSKYHPALI